MVLSLLSSLLSWVLPFVTPTINPDITLMMLNVFADVPPLPAFHLCQSVSSKLALTVLCMYRISNSVSQWQFCFAQTCLPGEGELRVYPMRLGLSYIMQMYIIWCLDEAGIHRLKIGLNQKSHTFAFWLFTPATKPLTAMRFASYHWVLFMNDFELQKNELKVMLYPSTENWEV